MADTINIIIDCDDKDIGFSADKPHGTTDHSQLENRDKENQHPINSITGLTVALEEKLPKTELSAAIAATLKAAKESGDFKGEPGEKGDTGEPGADGKDAVLPDGIMVFKGNMGYSKPSNPKKGDVYYCDMDITESKEFYNLRLGNCDYIGDNHVVIGMDENTNEFFKNAIGNNYTLYRLDDTGNIITSFNAPITSVEDYSSIYFSGTTQARLEEVFSYSSAKGYGIIESVKVEPFIKGRIVLYTGSEWRIVYDGGIGIE